MDERSLYLKTNYSLNWTYGLCEICLKNAHKEEKLVLRTIVSPDDETKQTELYVCTQCGSTRKI